MIQSLEVASLQDRLVMTPMMTFRKKIVNEFHSKDSMFCFMNFRKLVYLKPLRIQNMSFITLLQIHYIHPVYIIHYVHRQYIIIISIILSIKTYYQLTFTVSQEEVHDQ